MRRIVPVHSPVSLLRLASGGPRGFWAFGQRWVAHAGVIEDIQVQGPGDGDRSCGTDSRFAAVAASVAKVARALDPDPAGARLFGGFSFLPDASQDRVWASFPSARFQLPQIELVHHPSQGACTLVARARSKAGAEHRCAAWERSLLQEGDRRARYPPFKANVRRTRIGRPGASMERALWNRMVEETLSRIGSGEAKKVVLARTMDVSPPTAVGPVELAAALWEENHGSHVFLFEPAAGEALVGAAPEDHRHPGRHDREGDGRGR